MTNDLATIERDELSPCLRLTIPALAMWLGWGIRGQIGHERGAMIPGSLVGLSLALTASDPEIRRRAGLLGAAGAMGTSFGGTETYAQTIGLTQNATRDETYWWGMLGLAVKGGVWIGLSGTYLGMAVSEKDYTPFELLWLTGTMTALWHLGVETVNRPHEAPDDLPRIYFSGPRGVDKPRPEVWAGQWFALLGLLSYAALIRRDRSAAIMGAYGILGGAAGFAGAQAVQAALQARRDDMPDWFRHYVDIWKIMETGFGLIAGAYLSAGLMMTEAAGRRLRPRKDISALESTIGRAAGYYALAEHLQDRPWTERAMDSMVIGNAAMANAFACNTSAWLEALPLVHAYTTKDTIEYWRHEAKWEEPIPILTRWSGIAAALMAALSPLLARAQGSGSRWPAAIGMLLSAWGQSMLSHVKMLLDREMFETGEEEPKALPAAEVVKRVAEGSKQRRPGQFATETAFTVVAVLLTGLAAWALSKRGD